MLSMTICGFASGSSQGRSAMDFGVAAIRTPPLELRRRRRTTPVRREERTFDDLRSRHPTLPYEFTVQVDFRPDRRADPEMRRIDHSKGDITLASRRPYRGRDAPDIAFAAVIGVEKRVVCGLVAGDIQADESAARTLRSFGQQRTPPREMPLVEIHQPTTPQL